jgi:hypothetical protein
MDPITLLAAASAVWNGIKKASEFAQEAEGVWSQLSKYAGLADQLEQHITTAKNKPAKPKLFGKLDFSSDTQQAFNAFEAEHKLMSIENEIRHEFLYGAFCNLEGGYGSLDGYRKFLRDAPQDQGRPHPHEARATRYAKEVLGRHVSLWWQFNRRGSWVPASVHGS